MNQVWCIHWGHWLTTTISLCLLLPLHRTLGGLSTSESLGNSRTSSPNSPALLVQSTPSAQASPNPAPLPSTAAPARVFPETWLPMGPSQDFLQVPVSPEDRSYRTVYSLFHRTVSETRFRILRILRVQNPYLWEKYKR